jgi:hypothetical protein
MNFSAATPAGGASIAAPAIEVAGLARPRAGRAHVLGLPFRQLALTAVGRGRSA